MPEPAKPEIVFADAALLKDSQDEQSSGVNLESLDVTPRDKLRTLTVRQREIYDVIRTKIELDGIPPTIREIGDAAGINSPNGVMSHLKSLETKRMIDRVSGAARAIRLVDVPDTSNMSQRLLDSSLLTRRQMDIFRFICEFANRNGFSPTIREIGSEFAIGSPNGVNCHLRALQKKGFIVRRGTARGLQILGKVAPVEPKQPTTVSTQVESSNSLSSHTSVAVDARKQVFLQITKVLSEFEHDPT